jgi:anti-anti-sigma factor
MHSTPSSLQGNVMTEAHPVSILRIEGELTIYRAEELCLTFRNALAAGSDLEVDLSAVTEMDSAGVQLLIAAKKAAGAMQREVRLTEHSAAVREIFEILDLDTHLGAPSPVSA